MPGWHKATKKLVSEGKLQIVGVVQEQHRERAQLYAQWQQFDWPILQDQMTSLGLAVVPVAILLDEHGVVQSLRPRTSNINELVATKRNPPAATEKEETQLDDVRKQIVAGDDALKNGDSTAAIKAYESAFAAVAESEVKTLKPILHFRLGVAYRAHFDDPELSRRDDFEVAAKHWSEARSGNPNQYIWRRRIEQYGPRMIKPYPFYDWVDKAISEIKKRGDTPVEQLVALTETEIAKPARGASQKMVPDQANPDPESKVITTDRISLAKAIVPTVIKRGQSTRVHLRFLLPGSKEKLKWNNESTPMKIWFDKSSDGVLPQQLFTIDNANEANSTETRTLEFDLRSEKGEGPITLKGFGLVNLCDDATGQCFYRRFNFEFEIETK